MSQPCGTSVRYRRTQAQGRLAPPGRRPPTALGTGALEPPGKEPNADPQRTFVQQVSILILREAALVAAQACRLMRKCAALRGGTSGADDRLECESGG